MPQQYIWDAQNTPDRQRLVRGFARLYSDAKTIFAIRVVAVFLLAAAGSIVAITQPGLRTVVGGVGGVVLLALSVAVGSIEKWFRMRAAATQEKFDTEVFDLPWNGLHADKPSPQVIAKAAKRYKGDRDKDWYSDTKKTSHPFDVLISQSSNFGWGASMHRTWGFVLIVFAVALAGVIALVDWIADLSAPDTFVALVLPALAPFKELGEQVKANFEAAKTKEAAQRKVADLWDEGMNHTHIPTGAEVRSVQDKILLLRQSNPYVPDWLDNLLHNRNEATMRETAEDKVAQAERSGHTEEPS